MRVLGFRFRVQGFRIWVSGTGLGQFDLHLPARMTGFGVRGLRRECIDYRTSMIIDEDHLRFLLFY